jgi:hypothetical protein
MKLGFIGIGRVGFAMAGQPDIPAVSTAFM